MVTCARRRMAAALAVALAIGLAMTAPASANLVVSLTFDDGYASQYTTRSMLASHGMRGTYFVFSDAIGSSGYMTWSQLADLAADGNEIGGHTLTHVDLTTKDATEVRRQLCVDRNTLLSRGFAVTDVAYPYGAFNADVELAARQCGYNSGRTTLWYQAQCWSPCTESIPPRDAYATTIVGFGDQSLTELISELQTAERHGGWAQVLVHQVCDGCATSPATLNGLLDWLQPRAARGTVVKPVRDVIAGAVAPPVD